MKMELWSRCESTISIIKRTLNKVRRNWVFIFAFLFIISIFPAAYALSTYRGIELNLSAQIAGTVGSLFLTLLLAYLYRELRNIQEEQTKIQRRQQNILERRHQPRLIIDRWEINKDDLIFKLTNVGNAAALDIRYCIDIAPAGEKIGIQLENHPDIGLGDAVPFRRMDSDAGEQRNVLKPGETGDFEGIARVNIASNDRHNANMPYSEYEEEIVSNINQHEQDEVWDGTSRVRILLIYFAPFTSTTQELPDRLQLNDQPNPGSPKHERMIKKSLLDINIDTKERGSFENVITADVSGHHNVETAVLPENFDSKRRERYRSQKILLNYSNEGSDSG